MHRRALEARRAIAGEPYEAALPRPVAPNRHRLAGGEVGDGRPCSAATIMRPAPIDEERIFPRPAGEKIRAQAAIEDIVTRPAINGVIAAQAIDEVVPVGGHQRLRCGIAEELILQPGDRPRIEIGQFVAGNAPAAEQDQALICQRALERGDGDGRLATPLQGLVTSIASRKP